MSQMFGPNGGGNSLPANASGFLDNDGAGNLAWAQPNGSNPTTFSDIVSTKASVVRNGGLVDQIYDSFFTAYNYSLNLQQALLLENIAAGATVIRMAANAISPTDTYSDATTGWSIFNQAASLAISTATKKVGPTGAIQFSKLSGGTITVISRTPTSKSLQNNLKHVFWMNFPASVAGLSQVFFRVGTDSSNYMEWEFNTSGTPTEAGSSIQVGWNLFLQDISSGWTQVGTGWTNSAVPGYYGIGFYALNTSSFSGILVDALYFGDSTTTGIQLGNELSIYNTATKDIVTIDAVHSTKTTGSLFLASGISNSYTADQTAFIQRTSIGASGMFVGAVPGSSVYAGTIAEHRQTLPMQTDGATSMFEGMIDYYQGYFYPITSVTSGSSANIVINAGADIHSFYANPSTLDIFATLGDSNGNAFYKARTGATYTTNGAATNSSGFITVPMSSVSGVTLGDYVLKRCVDLQYSTTAAGANESYTPMTLQRVEVLQPYVAIPDFAHVYGYYTLSNNLTNQIPNTTGSNFSQTGTVVQTNNNYFNSHTSSGVYSASNFLGLSNAQNMSGNATDTPNGMGVAIWFKAPQSSTNRTVISFNGNTTNGHFLLLGSANTIILQHSATPDITASSGSWSASSAWTFVYYYINSSTPTETMYVNGVLIGSAAVAYASPGTSTGVGIIGLSGQGVNPLSDGYVADVILWRSGNILSQQQISQLYNNGVPPLYYSGSLFRNRYVANNISTSGQIEAKAILTQATSGEATFIRNWGFGRRT